MKQISAKQLASCGMVAAVYVALSIGLAPIAFGALQFRVAECLTLLAVFSPSMIFAVTVGCFLSNAIGVAMGLNIPQDILFGTLATLLAGIATWKLRNVRHLGMPMASAIPPILFNAVIIGWEIAFFLVTDTAFWPAFGANALSVGIGQLGSCGVLGLLLVAALERTGADRLVREV